MLVRVRFAMQSKFQPYQLLQMRPSHPLSAPECLTFMRPDCLCCATLTRSARISDKLRDLPNRNRLALITQGKSPQLWIILKPLDTEPAPPITSRRATMDMPCFANPGAFLDLRLVLGSSLCKRAANVTSSVALWTWRTQLKPALRIDLSSKSLIWASKALTQWTGRFGEQSTKPG